MCSRVGFHNNLVLTSEQPLLVCAAPAVQCGSGFGHCAGGDPSSWHWEAVAPWMVCDGFSPTFLAPAGRTPSLVTCMSLSTGHGWTNTVNHTRLAAGLSCLLIGKHSCSRLSPVGSELDWQIEWCPADKRECWDSNQASGANNTVNRAAEQLFISTRRGPSENSCSKARQTLLSLSSSFAGEGKRRLSSLLYFLHTWV